MTSIKKNPGQHESARQGATALAFAVAMLFSGSALAAGFTNVAASSGAEFAQESEDQAPIGAGAAWVDVDGDGDDDLFAAQATGCNRLYINDGAGNFSEPDTLDALGAGLCAEITRAVSAADYDNDGDQDLFVTQRGQNRLLRNMLIETGALSFTDETANAAMDNDGALNSASAVWGDYDGDGDLDIFTANHRDFSQVDFTCHGDKLWRNEGDGTFVDVGGPTGITMGGNANKIGCALAATWTDYDNDGDLDLIVQNDFGQVNGVPDRVFRNDGSDGLGGWIFSDQSDASGLNYAQAGMGVAIGDIDGNGWFDYYLSDRGDNELAMNNGGIFTESAAAAGVLANDFEIYGEAGLVSWGDGLYDLDRDGDEDLVVANGGAPRDKWPGGMFGADYIDLNPAYVYRNNGDSTFVELHQQMNVTSEGYYRTAVFSDMDNDGDIDFFLGNLQGNNALYRNDLENSNAWLKVRTSGTVGNRDGIGARILVDANGTRQMRETRSGSGFLSRDSLTAHVGLSNATVIDRVQVTFLNDIHTEHLDVAPGQTLEIVEPRMSAVFANDEKMITAGDPIQIDLNIRNHDKVARLAQIWIDRVTPSGTQSTIIGPRTLNMPAGFDINRTINLSTPPTMAPGTHKLLVRFGTYPNSYFQQDVAFVEVAAP